MPHIQTKMNEGDTFLLDDNLLIYDNEGIALKLNPRNIKNLHRAVETDQPIKDHDVMNRRFTVRFLTEQSLFVFDIVGEGRLEVIQDNVLVLEKV